MIFSVSIIVCSYNPTEKIFSRLLKSLTGLKKEKILHEIILVDNNSTPSILERGLVDKFLKTCPNTSVIIESQVGLTAARLAGISASHYNWLLFFDDDNEPAEDYLIRAAEATQNYSAAILGPGTIEVEYIDGHNKWLNNHKGLFQERNEAETRFDNNPHWQQCYPFGTGMIVSREIAVEYAKRVKQGRYTLSDRKEESLASGGDVQIVLTAVEKGYTAGVVAGLKLKHLIDSCKANISYMRRQQYGTSSAYIRAYNEVFNQSPILQAIVTNKQILLKIYSMYRIYGKHLTKEDFQLMLASKLGEVNAAIIATRQKKPLILKFMEYLLHV